MPVYRDKSGRLVEEKTNVVGKNDKENTEKTKQQQASDYDAPTNLISRGKGDGAAPVRSTSSGEEKTQLLGRGRAKTPTAQGQPQNGMDNPPVGWLVVIKGPGQGFHLPIGYGQNSIGRGQDQRICLNFGDEEISRAQHATITYDPRGRKFYVQQGSGKNLVYIDGAPVLTPTSLAPLTDVHMGKTVLRFVPFCGEQFDWQELKDE